MFDLMIIWRLLKYVKPIQSREELDDVGFWILVLMLGGLPLTAVFYLLFFM